LRILVLGGPTVVPENFGRGATFEVESSITIGCCRRAVAQTDPGCP
jgi:hypothetical protein